MAEYELTPGAELDLLETALYTIKTWGLDQANRYEAALEDHFNGIAQGMTRSKTVLEHRPEIQVSRCQHHYVFSLRRDEDCPLIVAVFHEKMDLMTRLRERLHLEGER